MSDPQLLSYIKGQLQAGTDREKIRGALQANGWPLVMIEEAFSSLEPNTAPKFTPTTSPTSPTSPTSQPEPQAIQSAPNHHFKAMAVVLILLVVLGVGAFFGTKYFLNDINFLPVETPTNTQTNTQPSANSQCANNDLNCLLAAAQTCSPNSVLNVSSGVSTKHEIVGIDGVNCHYKEAYLGGTVAFSQSLIEMALKEGTTQQEIDGMRDFLQTATDDVKGKIADCKAPLPELVAYLQARINSIKEFEETGGGTSSSESIESKFWTERCTGLY